METSLPNDPERVKSFATFFKNYMSVSTIVTASLPIPITSLKLIPLFEAHRTFLSTYASLFCFLMLGFIFYIRHSLAYYFFEDNLQRRSLLSKLLSWFIKALPLILILGSVGLLYYYHFLLEDAIYSLKYKAESKVDTEHLLANTSFDMIPHSNMLTIVFLGVFVLAESAFILMAIKEYLQDLLGLQDKDLLLGKEMYYEKMAAIRNKQIKKHQDKN